MLRSTLPSLMVLCILAGCGKTDSPPATANVAPAQPAADKESKTACELVTQEEMSTILGGPVVAKNTDRTGKTECIYSSTATVGPYAELTVEWGSGAAAMQAMGMLNSREPGLTSPYDGIGDQAVATGPALMIQTGEDLVTIVLSIEGDVPAAAKRIFDTAKARM